MSRLLERISEAEVDGLKRTPVDGVALKEAIDIVEDVRSGGEIALRRQSRRLGDLTLDEPIVRPRPELRRAYEGLDSGQQELLMRIAGRIETFARSQREALTDVSVDVPGGRAGHRWVPVRSAGAYAPGGRYPLPSTVLMTVIPSRVAGVETVWVASPRPSSMTLAASWVAGADGLLAVGGAQAIAALAFGTVSPACDLIVGPGNKWVTAAKKHLYGEIGIDFLAGPSEIVVIADGDADPVLVAADLLAQAEHDPAAMSVLVTTEEGFADRVEKELERQLEDLPTSQVARQSLATGYVIIAEDLAAAARLSERIAPEHLALHVSNPEDLDSSLAAYGSVFLGSSSAEAFADYGAGPNHVLPTGGGARFQAGLSVTTFLKAATWLDLDRPDELVEDTVSLARLERLEAHARAAARRSEHENPVIERSRADIEH